MGLPSNTEKLLAEFESTYFEPQFKNYRLGLLSELFVAQHYLKNGWKWVEHRKKIFSTEIDLVFESKKSLLFVEVKRSSNDDFLIFRLSKRQRQRLTSVYMLALEQTSKEILFHYAIAGQSGEVSVFEDFL